jgi:hypothetical protein
MSNAFLSAKNVLLIQEALGILDLIRPMLLPPGGSDHVHKAYNHLIAAYALFKAKGEEKDEG